MAYKVLNHNFIDEILNCLVANYVGVQIKANHKNDHLKHVL